MKKKVLIITYYWPPSGGPGVQRVLHFVRNLPEYGWDPIVLTVQDGEYPALDPALEKLVPDSVKVIKTKTLEPFQWYKRLTGKKKDHKIDTYILSNKKGSFLENMMRWIRLNLFIPDARIGWLPYAVRAAKKVIRTEEIDVIYSCSPPHTVQVVAKKVADGSQKPWIADFRDPWSSIVFYQDSTRSGITRSLDQRMEKGVLEGADHLITTCQGFKDTLSSDFHLDESKITVITNGYDGEQKFSSHQSRDLIITYAGNLSEVRMPYALLESLGTLRKEKPGVRIKLHVAGNLCALFEEELKRLNISDLLVKHGYISHGEVLQLYSKSDLLLLVVDKVPDNHLFIAGKLFDYLGAKRPVLAFGPEDGEVREIIRETDSGYYFAYEDKQNTLLALQRELDQKINNQPSQFTFSGREKYSRKALTGRLAGLLDEMMEK